VVDDRALRRAADLALEPLGGLPERSVGERASIDELRAALDVPLEDASLPSLEVIERLAAAVEPGLVASAGPRYFGFVIGGALPSAVAADWLTSAWDQNAGGYPVGPSASVAEEVACAWLLDLLGLPADAGVGLTTGCQMAHVTCLAAARHRVLRDAGWDVEAEGLFGAPAVRVLGE
jgi:glutamate/tyrosine decarboxylase-like PLP-dependent enzyme